MTNNPRVAAGALRQERERIPIDFDTLPPQPSIPVGDSPAKDLRYARISKRLEYIHSRPRNEWRIDFEERVLGSRADQHDDAILDPREQRILL